MAALAALMQSAATYVQYEVNDETRGIAQRMLAAAAASEGDDAAVKELRNAFGSRLEFGTAGLRGEMNAGWNRMNDVTVIQAAQGIACYLVSEFGAAACAERGVVLGYDHRARGSITSHRFALLSAAALLHKGIRVRIFRSFVCTPMVPFSVLKYGAVAGIMVTASHNPKADNGYKVYGDNGAQIISPVDKHITSHIASNLAPWQELRATYELPSVGQLEGELPALSPGTALSLDDDAAATEAYIATISSQLCHHRELNASSPVKIAYTAMHGVGTPFAVRAFAAFGHAPFHEVAEQCKPDPEFPTVAFPNPEEGKGALALAMATAQRVGATLILANDPDADRLAVAEWVMPAPPAAGSGAGAEAPGAWRIFSGNEIGALLADWTWRCYRSRAPELRTRQPWMVASTVSSALLAAMAQAEGFSFRETLTGFKFMGNAMAEAEAAGDEVLFAFEEAIGFACCGTAVRDKDGVSAAAVFAEMAAALARERGVTASQRLAEIYAKYGTFVSNNRYLLVDEPAKTSAIFARLRNEGHYWARLGGLRIAAIRDLTITLECPGGWDSAAPDGVPKLPVSSGTHMLTYTFSNGVRATLRTSGTEPKLKWYAELQGATASGPEGVAAAAAAARTELDKTVGCILDEMLQPEAHGLVRPVLS